MSEASQWKQSRLEISWLYWLLTVKLGENSRAVHTLTHGLKRIPKEGDILYKYYKELCAVHVRLKNQRQTELRKRRCI